MIDKLKQLYYRFRIYQLTIFKPYFEFITIEYIGYYLNRNIGTVCIGCYYRLHKKLRFKLICKDFDYRQLKNFSRKNYIDMGKNEFKKFSKQELLNSEVLK